MKRWWLVLEAQEVDLCLKDPGHEIDIALVTDLLSLTQIYMGDLSLERAIGILELFDAVISSEDAGRPKPAPDVFLLAAERIAVAPSHCVAFEDADAGLQAALAAGMRAVDIRPWLER